MRGVRLIGMAACLAALVLGGTCAPGMAAAVRRAARAERPGLPLTGPETGAQFAFEHFTTASGLSNNTVWAILQDRQGFLWIGTADGLNRYDGYQFTVYRHDPDDDRSLSHNTVRTLYEDGAGELWVGTSAGLDRFDRTSGTFVHYPSFLENGGVLALGEDSNGTLWVGLSSAGLGRLERAREMVGVYAAVNAPDESRRPSGPIDAILKDRRGQLWLGTDAGLDQLDPTTGVFTHTVHDPASATSLSPGGVAALLEDRQGSLWIGTTGGLDGFDPVTRSFVHYRHDPSAPASLADNRVVALLEDRAGRLLVGTLGGLDLLDRAQGSFVHYRHDPGDARSLSNDLVLSLYEDRSGVLWVGTYEGLNKYSSAANRFRLYQTHPGTPGSLSDNIVTNVYEDRQGRLWLTTFKGGLNELDPATGRFTTYRHDPADPSRSSDDVLQAIYEDHQGTLWVGTASGWLEQFDRKSGRFQRAFDLTAVGGAYALAEDSAGNLWVGTENGLLLLDPSAGAQRFYRPLDSPQAVTAMTQIREDTAGWLWVGTAGLGLYRLDKERQQLQPYPYDPGSRESIRRGVVLAIYPAADGTVWVGTDTGLERFAPEAQTPTAYGPAEGMAGQQVRCIAGDGAGYLWLATEKGLSRFDPRGGTFLNLNMYDGLPGGELLSCQATTQGEVLFGGLNGLVAFDPAAIQDNALPPPVAITALYKSNRQVPGDVQPGQRLALAYDDSFISFDYAALDYQAPAKNLYAYRMEGLDPDWVAAGTRRHADYPDLRPGDYVFRVKAANNDGVWNEEGTALHITVVAPFWERWWFRGLVAVALAGGVAAAYGLRVRSIRARSRELEAEVASRTRELAERYSAEQRRAEQFRVLAEVGRQVTSILEIEPLLQAIVRLVQQSFGYYHVGIGMVEGDEVVYRVGAGPLWDDPGFAFRPARLKVGQEGLTGWVAAQGELLAVPDVSQEPRYVWMQGSATRSECVAPIVSKGQVIGVLDVQSDRPNAFDPIDLAVLQSLAHQVGAAIANARLYEQAQHVATMAERNRLARDLHDSVTQSLYSLTLLVEAGQRMLKARELERAEQNQARLGEISRQALQEMRLFVYELRPLAPETGGLVGTLEQRLEAVERRAGVDARLVVEGEGDLPPQMQEELYRIALESLNNSLKHAGATTVTVTLRIRQEEVLLEVRDNGRGFDPAAVAGRGGMGLANMQERARTIGGQLSIVSAPGAGSCVRFVVPNAGGGLPGSRAPKEESP